MSIHFFLLPIHSYSHIISYTSTASCICCTICCCCEFICCWRLAIVFLYPIICCSNDYSINLHNSLILASVLEFVGVVDSSHCLSLSVYSIIHTNHSSHSSIIFCNLCNSCDIETRAFCSCLQCTSNCWYRTSALSIILSILSFTHVTVNSLSESLLDNERFLIGFVYVIYEVIEYKLIKLYFNRRTD